MSEIERLTKAAGVVGLATLLSRVLGFVRDMVIALFLGAGFYADAFFVAFRLPNLGRKLLADGILSLSFVPVLTQYSTTQGEAETFRMARSFTRLLALVLIAVTLVGIVSMPLIVKGIAPGFGDHMEKYRLTVRLARIVFPYLLVVGLAAVFTSVLNVLGHFGAPAFGQLLVNGAMIGSVGLAAYFTRDPGVLALVLAAGLLVGGAGQVWLLIPALLRKGFSFRPPAPLYHPGIRRAGRLMIPAVFGASVFQINVVVNTIFASFLPEGSVSYLYYADRLVQFPLGVVAIAAGTAVLPSLSRQAARGEYDRLTQTFVYALKMVFFITLPAMVGLIVLREPIVALLFERGAFDGRAVRLTAGALLFYGSGLWAVAGVRILVSTLYALQDARNPVWSGLATILLNAGLCWVLMKPLGHEGLALAASLASMANFLLLSRTLWSRYGMRPMDGLFISIGKSLLGSVFMGLVVFKVSEALLPPGNHSSGGQCLALMISILSGTIAYALFAFAVGHRELKSAWRLFRKGPLTK